VSAGDRQPVGLAGDGSRAPGGNGAEPLVRIEHLVKHFPAKRSGNRHATVRAVDDVSLEVARGETLGLVGETGCGKSTLARCVVRLHDVTSGKIFFDGAETTHLGRRELQPFRQRMQLVFQDPYGSLNPRRRVGSILADPFRLHGGRRLLTQAVSDDEERKRRVQELMGTVGLNPEHYNRFPSEFSGGQRQRIGIARAIALRPELIVCDEPVSALDVSIRAQILNLLAELQEGLGLTYLFISHDLSVVEHVSDRVAVMYLGKVVEVAPSVELYRRPRHPYTAALLSAVPVPDPDAPRRSVVLHGDPPSPIDPPKGCRFHPRCPKAQPICAREEPPLVPRQGDDLTHKAACHFPLADGEKLRQLDAAEVGA
jgi:oligopeptide/dipeptide ABC transporter ATP-binding protein